MRGIFVIAITTLKECMQSYRRWHLLTVILNLMGQKSTDFVNLNNEILWSDITIFRYSDISNDPILYCSQGSCLVFQLIFATLDMFFKENSKSSQKIEIPGGPIFRAIFSLSFRAKISLGSLFKQLELLFQKSVKRSSNCLQRDPDDIFALKDKEKMALKIGPAGFSIFWLLFEIKIFFCAKHVHSDKNNLEYHSVENQTWSPTVGWW